MYTDPEFDAAIEKLDVNSRICLGRQIWIYRNDGADLSLSLLASTQHRRALEPHLVAYLYIHCYLPGVLPTRFDCGLFGAMGCA